MENGKNYPVSVLKIGRAEFETIALHQIVIVSYESEILEIRVPKSENNFHCLLMLGYDFNLYEEDYVFNCEYDKISQNVF